VPNVVAQREYRWFHRCVRGAFWAANYWGRFVANLAAVD